MKQPGKSKRIFYIDNLKVFLIFLVIIHHVGQAYGPPPGFWPYVQTNPHESISWLGRFFCVNAAFFMGLFFMISGYFFTPSFEKKGAKSFVKDKLIRFGIPLALVYFIMMPAILYFHYANFSGNPQISFVKYMLNIYWGIGEQPAWFRPSIGWPESNFGFGHLWFVEHLLIYSVIYAILRSLIKTKINYGGLAVKDSTLIIFLVAAIAIPTMIVRRWYPIDRWIDIFGFIQSEVAHLPQYLILIITGIIAYKLDLFNKFNKTFGLSLAVLGLGMAVLIYFSPYFDQFAGFIVWKNFEIYETILCISLCFGLIVVFREYFNKTSSTISILADNSFSAYIFHFPIVIFIQYSFDSINIDVLSKFVIVSIISIIASYSFSYLIRKIDFVKKIV